MRDADGRRHLLNVLSTVTGRMIDIDPEVIFWNVNLQASLGISGITSTAANDV